MKKVLVFFIVIICGKLSPAQDSAICRQQEIIIKELSVLWQQQAAEYRALCYQAFNMAGLRLNEALKNKPGKQKLAIITDLDETILNNSYSEAQLIKDGKEYSNQLWKDWIRQSAATGVPGAVEFLQMAQKKGIVIFYISNRDKTDVANTLINLKKLQLPYADTSHMLFLSNTSSKEPRRQLVMSRYNVVMLLGDNLNDFMQVFEAKNCSSRLAETDKVKSQWGRKFIVLPNATYGEWENAVYDYDRKLDPGEREAKRKSKLTGYK